jgi:hypothetical protein
VANPSAFRDKAERQRRRIDQLRAKLQAHITTRDREPAVVDRHLSTVLQSHRHDIRGVIEGSLDLLDMVQKLVEDHGTKAGPEGPKGDPGAPGHCTCTCGTCEMLQPGGGFGGFGD